jgi:hypothetical protein
LLLILSLLNIHCHTVKNFHGRDKKISLLKDLLDKVFGLFEGELNYFSTILDLILYFFYRYDTAMKSEEENKKKFNLLESLRASVRPSVYRRMTIILQSMGEEERALLLRWSGNVDIDPDTLLNLTNGTTQINIQ